MSLLDHVKNTTHSIYKSTAEYLTSDKSLKVSKFNKKGVLTPDEFIKAGCQLVYKCPTWQWEGGDDKKKKKYFPSNQQYLITRSVPCLKRVSSLKMDNKTVENIVENGEWLTFDNKNNKNNTNDDDLQDIEDIDDINEVYEENKDNNNDNNNKNNNNNEVVNNDNNDKNIDNNNNNDNNDKTEKNEDNDDDDDEFSDFEEIPDIETFNDDDNIVTNEDKIKDIKKKSNENESKNDDTNDDILMKTRTYDISITYDKYYRVPRVWLRGYDENKNPLTSSQIFEDISADHAHKTVTVEQHPHMSAICASIHPCRHADVMKIFMERMEENGSKFTVDQYMFLFLKFMNAVIPTIEYDFTMQASTK